MTTLVDPLNEGAYQGTLCPVSEIKAVSFAVLISHLEGLVEHDALQRL